MPEVTPEEKARVAASVILAVASLVVAGVSLYEATKK